MQYHNKKTGALLSTDCVISGGDWEPVQPAPARPGEDDTTAADEVDGQDEAPPAKPAARRAAKKKEA